MSHQPMSMEAMLDEERRDVLALLEGNPIARSWNSGSPIAVRAPSPYTSPRSPIRSILSGGGDDNASISSTGGKKSPPQAIRSMLDVDSPPPPPVRSMLDIDSPIPALNGPGSPIETNFRASNTNHPRSSSDSSQRPDLGLGPRSSVTRIDPTAGYQFSDFISNNPTYALPKRNTQAGKRPSAPAGAGVMAEVMRGNDLQTMVLPGDRGRHHSIAGPTMRRNNGSKSKSPHNRMGMRSHSPNVSGRFQPIPGTATLDDGRVVDISNAYRKLSDANLAFSGGSLSQLAQRKRSSTAEDGSGRLAKDYLSPDGDELEDSSDEEHPSSSDDEHPRGRGVSPRVLDNTAGPRSPELEASKGGRKTLSLLAAAEEERIQIANLQPKYQYRSLLDEPEITVTSPTGEKAKPSKPGVHPSTSYDQGPHSGAASVIDSDEEADLTDIKRAQKLAFSMTPIISTPDTHRAIRIVYRGEFSKIQQQAEDEHHRLRKYLVATDLSDESTHALEWAIGTVLRDGDTLMAIYCVDEETGIVTADGSLVPDEPKAMKEQAAAINAVTTAKAPPVPANPTPVFPHLPRASALSFAAHDSQHSQSPGPSSRERTKAEEERHRAVEDITVRVTRLLRKTNLQVRVIVEVLHCKNPKHLITEIIDLVNPTLVILGSRGRSALKGVILGSFSNYLVTKSSVPVMVARKRLRKQSKYKRTAVRQVNNLSNPTARSLANAKID